MTPAQSRACAHALAVTSVDVLTSLRLRRAIAAAAARGPGLAALEPMDRQLLLRLAAQSPRPGVVAVLTEATA